MESGPQYTVSAHSVSPSVFVVGTGVFQELSLQGSARHHPTTPASARGPAQIGTATPTAATLETTRIKIREGPHPLGSGQARKRQSSLKGNHKGFRIPTMRLTFSYSLLYRGATMKSPRHPLMASLPPTPTPLQRFACPTESTSWAEGADQPLLGVIVTVLTMLLNPPAPPRHASH